jgi:hypothetical protein
LTLFLLAACQPEPTPFPVDVPSPYAATSVPTTTGSPSVRYALAANTEGFAADLELIEAVAQVEQLTHAPRLEDLGNRFDILAAYADLPGGTRSPVVPHVSLVVNPVYLHSTIPWSPTSYDEALTARQS